MGSRLRQLQTDAVSVRPNFTQALYYPCFLRAAIFGLPSARPPFSHCGQHPPLARRAPTYIAQARYRYRDVWIGLQTDTNEEATVANHGARQHRLIVTDRD